MAPAIAAAPVDGAASASSVAAAPAEPASAALDRPVSLREGVPITSAPVAVKDPAKGPPKETSKERRARETREREARAAAAPIASGQIRLAVSPWGQVEVDGTPVGTAPPLTEITLSEGKHQIIIRNADFPPYSASISITAGTPVMLKHRFGS